MIWNDLSGEEEEEESSFIEDEECEGSVSATDLFAESDDFDDIVTDDSLQNASLALSLKETLDVSFCFPWLLLRPQQGQGSQSRCAVSKYNKPLFDLV